jgi:ABC-2 type transport system permease protein
MAINPVSYAVSAIRQALYLPGPSPVPFASLGVCIAVTVAFAIVLVALAVYVVKQPLFRAKRMTAQPAA